MDLRLLRDCALVKPIKPDASHVGGILVPDTARRKSAYGEIVAVGPGKRNQGGGRDRPDIAVGDVVLFDELAGAEVKVEGLDFMIISASDIFCIIDEAR